MSISIKCWIFFATKSFSCSLDSCLSVQAFSVQTLRYFLEFTQSLKLKSMNIYCPDPKWTFKDFI